MRVCFVCLGNICRSPTAEGVMRKLVTEAGLEQQIAVESAGTAGYHVGEPADARARAAAKRRGVDLSGRARQFQQRDFARFDLVLAMDPSNRDNLLALAVDAKEEGKVRLLRDYDPAASREAAVPDPYYGGAEGFEEVLDICQAACGGLLEELRTALGVPRTSRGN